MPHDITLAITSDWHANFKYGLMNPKVILYDETEDGDLVPYTPKLTAMQVYLWDLQETII